ncbi:MAG: hypothetical protein R3E87_03425 [Burkholderiaceae bacterium]
MRTVAETPIFIRYAEQIWREAERLEFISWIALNHKADDPIPGWMSEGSLVVARPRQERWGAGCLLQHH